MLTWFGLFIKISPIRLLTTIRELSTKIAYVGSALAIAVYLEVQGTVVFAIEERIADFHKGYVIFCCQ